MGRHSKAGLRLFACFYAAKICFPHTQAERAALKRFKKRPLNATFYHQHVLFLVAKGRGEVERKNTSHWHSVRLLRVTHTHKNPHSSDRTSPLSGCEGEEVSAPSCAPLRPSSKQNLNVETDWNGVAGFPSSDLPAVLYYISHLPGGFLLGSVFHLATPFNFTCCCLFGKIHGISFFTFASFLSLPRSSSLFYPQRKSGFERRTNVINLLFLLFNRKCKTFESKQDKQECMH